MNFFGKRKEGPSLFAELAVDFHNHVMPGIDDGSPTMEESLRMLRFWVELGYKKIIASPHVITALYPNTRDIILGQMYHMQDVISENNIPLEFEATAEYHLDFEFKGRLERGELIPFGKEKYLLIELPFQKPPAPVEEMIFDLQLEGFTPVLAHPERYIYLNSDFHEYHKLKDKGYLLQVNINSLTGMYNGRVKKTAEKLIKNEMVDFACSDAHNLTHLRFMKMMERNHHFKTLVSSGKLRNAELL